MILKGRDERTGFFYDGTSAMFLPTSIPPGRAVHLALGDCIVFWYWCFYGGANGKRGTKKSSNILNGLQELVGRGSIEFSRSCRPQILDKLLTVLL